MLVLVSVQPSIYPSICLCVPLWMLVRESTQLAPFVCPSIITCSFINYAFINTDILCCPCILLLVVLVVLDYMQYHNDSSSSPHLLSPLLLLLLLLPSLLLTVVGFKSSSSCDPDAFSQIKSACVPPSCAATAPVVQVTD